MVLTLSNFPFAIWIMMYLTDTGHATSTTYQLPALHGTVYTLHDVMVIPWTGDQINVTLSTRDNTTNNKTLTLTHAEEFRINKTQLSDNFNIEKGGIQISTSSKATVTIFLPSGQLHLGPISKCSKHYTFKNIFSQGNLEFMHIQLIHTNIVANICVTAWPEDGNVSSNAKSLLEGRNTGLTNCTELEKEDPLGLILQDVSSFQRLEINANQAVCVFQGYRTNSLSNISSPFAIQKDLNNSFPTMHPVNWRLTPTARERGNTFVLIPQKANFEAQLYIRSNINATINVSTVENMNHIQYIESNVWTAVGINTNDKQAIAITTENDVSLRCYRNFSDDGVCVVIPIQDVNTNSTHSSNSTQSLNYTWINYSQELVVTVLCQGPVVFALNSPTVNDNITKSQRELNIMGSVYQVLFLYDLSPGLYRLSVNNSINMCNVIYTNRGRYYQKTRKACEKEKEKEGITSLKLDTNENGVVNESLQTTNYSDEMLHTSIIDIISNMSKDIENSLDDVENISNTSTSTDTNSTDLIINPYATNTLHNTTFKTASLQTSVYNLKVQTEKPNQRTTKNTTLPELLGISDNASNVKDYSIPHNHNLNDRFKVVVDIVHTENEQVNILPTSQESDPGKYLYTDEFSGYMGVSDNKSFTAIFASLGAALLAVVLLILGFLLKEIFSRRQQRRNTRIRPFVSYY